MIIHSSFVSNQTGLTWNTRYEEVDTFDAIRSLPKSSEGGAVGALCFYGNKLVIVYANKRKTWEPPGGGLEANETLEEGITREIKEETNMKVLELFPLGYDTLTNPETKESIYQVRFAARLEPYGPFVSDGAADDQDITEIKLIDPKDVKNYFDWGERGDMMMNKAIKILSNRSILLN